MGSTIRRVLRRTTDTSGSWRTRGSPEGRLRAAASSQEACPCRWGPSLLRRGAGAETTAVDSDVAVAVVPAGPVAVEVTVPGDPACEFVTGSRSSVGGQFKTSGRRLKWSSESTCRDERNLSLARHVVCPTPTGLPGRVLAAPGQSEVVAHTRAFIVR